MSKSRTLFDDERMNWKEALELTRESLLAHAVDHRHWAIAWSGGKDSSTLLTVVLYLIETGQVPKPERLTVCYADTRMELPPLAIAAQLIIAELRRRGVEVRIVMAPMDKRFYVYMLGRGVPPPNNNTFRWCTRQIKVEPMQVELQRIVGELPKPDSSKAEAFAKQLQHQLGSEFDVSSPTLYSPNVLMLTGVRQGESAIRDGRIAMSCGVNGAECGQGWYQEMSGEGFATLAPILHWRVCHVWDWLKFHAPQKKFGAWNTRIIADAYGGDEAEEINARTGCVGCALANKDTALDTVLLVPEWSHLEPLKELRPIYRELREHRNRLRQPPGEARKDGSLISSQNRIGPLTMDARRWALEKILDIQTRCNAAAIERGLPLIDILNNEEVARIEELIAANTWPQKWTGNEPRADEPYIEDDNSGQEWLFDMSLES